MNALSQAKTSSHPMSQHQPSAAQSQPLPNTVSSHGSTPPLSPPPEQQQQQQQSSPTRSHASRGMNKSAQQQHQQQQQFHTNNQPAATAATNFSYKAAYEVLDLPPPEPSHSCWSLMCCCFTFWGTEEESLPDEILRDLMSKEEATQQKRMSATMKLMARAIKKGGDGGLEAAASDAVSQGAYTLGRVGFGASGRSSSRFNNENGSFLGLNRSGGDAEADGNSEAHHNSMLTTAAGGSGGGGGGGRGSPSSSSPLPPKGRRVPRERLADDLKELKALLIVDPSSPAVNKKRANPSLAHSLPPEKSTPMLSNTAATTRKKPQNNGEEGADEDDGDVDDVCLEDAFSRAKGTRRRSSSVLLKGLVEFRHRKDPSSKRSLRSNDSESNPHDGQESPKSPPPSGEAERRSSPSTSSSSQSSSVIDLEDLAISSHSASSDSDFETEYAAKNHHNVLLREMEVMQRRQQRRQERARRRASMNGASSATAFASSSDFSPPASSQRRRRSSVFASLSQKNGTNSSFRRRQSVSASVDKTDLSLINVDAVPPYMNLSPPRPGKKEGSGEGVLSAPSLAHLRTEEQERFGPIYKPCQGGYGSLGTGKGRRGAGGLFLGGGFSTGSPLPPVQSVIVFDHDPPVKPLQKL